MTTTAHTSAPGSPPRKEAAAQQPTTHATTPDEAVRALTAALAALNTDPTGTRVEDMIGRAGALLDGLEPGLTAIVLNRLLTSIRDCQREGRPTSAQLRARRASAARALHLDPRRHAHPDRKAS